MKKLLRFACLVQIFCGIVLTLGRVALGQTSKNDAHNAAVELGTDGAEIDDFPAAIAGWKQAYAIEPEWWLACSVGRLSIRTEELPQAAKYLNRCVRTAPPPRSDEWIKRRGEELLELETIKLHLVTVEVQADKGASIFANGELEDVAPCKFALFFAPGKITIEARLDGKSIKRELEAERGEKRSIDLSTPIERASGVLSGLPLLSLPPEPPRPLPFRPPSISTWQKIRVHLPLIGAVAGTAAAGLGAMILPYAYKRKDEAEEEITNSARATLAGNEPEAFSHLEKAKSLNTERAIFAGVGFGLLGLSGVLFTVAGVSASMDSVWMAPKSAGVKGSFTW